MSISLNARAVAVGVFVILMLALAAQPARADDTYVYFTFLPPGETDCGDPFATPPPEQHYFAEPGSTQEVVACVWAMGFNEPTGVAGFNLDFFYESEIVSPDFAPHLTWLESTGRAPSCSSPVTKAWPGDPGGRWHLQVSCDSLALSPPGPQVGGLLGAVTLQPTGQAGTAKLDHEITYLTRVASEDRIITTRGLDASVAFTTCADVTGAGGLPDGAVSIADLIAVIQHFGLTPGHPAWDPIYDLDQDGVTISIADIVAAVLQFGIMC
ncbi:MAG: hypothetical protein WBD55_02935 [Dehalococcoidia bacterium]